MPSISTNKNNGDIESQSHRHHKSAAGAAAGAVAQSNLTSPEQSLSKAAPQKSPAIKRKGTMREAWPSLPFGSPNKESAATTATTSYHTTIANSGGKETATEDETHRTTPQHTRQRKENCIAIGLELQQQQKHQQQHSTVAVATIPHLNTTKSSTIIKDDGTTHHCCDGSGSCQIPADNIGDGKLNYRYRSEISKKKIVLRNV